MKKLEEEEIKAICELLKEGKPLPEEYRWLLFEGRQETELLYAGKQREVDVIAETMAVPLQKVKVFGDVNDNEWHNLLIFGDNLQILKTLLKWKEEGKLKNPDGSKGVRLIYIDPPFGTGEIYGKGDVGAYSAKLMGAKYLEWLRQRIILLRELLSDDGSFYMRTDYHFGHYMKVLLDEIFGKENFRNEIIVTRGEYPKGEVNKLRTGNDNILFYVRSNKNVFLAPRKERNERKWFSMHLAGERSSYELQVREFFGKKLLPPKGRHWMISQEKINEIIEKGEIRINENKTYIDLQGNLVVGEPEMLQSEFEVLDSN
ncbi:MAG: DNA methyltransferase, partial [candidate division WOR-3 bacterium]